MTMPEGELPEELPFDWESEDTGDGTTDAEALYEDITAAEAEQGHLMGERIDTTDDGDAG